jgi:hypothetical protein
MKISEANSSQRSEAIVCHLYKLCVVIIIYEIVIMNECTIVNVVYLIRVRSI